MAAVWEGLPHDLLVLIHKKITLIDDFAAFGKVCKSWHAAAATTNKQHLRRPQAPWLLLPVTEVSEAERQIFSLSKQDRIANMPLFSLSKDRLTKNLYFPEMPFNKCIGLNYGWFLISSSRGGHMTLVHPLSRAQIPLPPRKTMAQRFPTDGLYLVDRAALSANPSESPSHFVVMIVHALGKGLHYCRPGDTRWTRAGAAAGRARFSDVTYHQDEGRFYAITYCGQVWTWTDLGPRQDSILAYQVTHMYWRSIKYTCNVVTDFVGGSTPGTVLTTYVVAGPAPGSVFVLLCFRDEIEIVKESIFTMTDRDGCDARHLRMWFQVYELDPANDMYRKVKSLGSDRAIFVGWNTSMALENASEYPGVKSNCIYFTNDSVIRWEKEVGSYNIEDGQTTHFRVDTSSPFRHFWFIPSF